MLLSLLLLLSSFNAKAATSSITVASTTSYSGADVASYQPTVRLPSPGAYIFTLNAVSTPTGAAFPTSVAVYLQEQGLSGNWYTINASTFTTCTSRCYLTVNSDLYHGGYIRPYWTVAGSSVSLTINAYKVNP